jgi:hypothetical protein
MIGTTASALPSVTLSPPTLLRLYTLCVVATTASLAIWGPQLISSIRDLVHLGTTSDSNPEQEPESTGETSAEEKTAENQDKKWKRKTQIW